jgi:transcriptional regulator with XRE-family HTH domain
MPTSHDRPRTRVARIAGRRLDRVVEDVTETLVQQRLDSGISQVALAGAAGVSRAYLCEIESGQATPSLDVLARLAAALGGEISVRIYPGTGPVIRDHLQVAMAEALLHMTDRSWRPRVEVPITAPTRGFADLLLHDMSRGQAVEVELHSQLRRVEQQLRWSQAKAEALAMTLPAGTEMHRLLVLRSTEATRHLVAANQSLFATAFPANVHQAHTALGDRALRWPGNVLLWATVASGRALILPHPPRGIRVGR